MTLEQLEAYRADRATLEAVTGELAEHETQVAVQSAATPPYSLHTATLTGLPSTPRVISLLERQAALRASCFAVERFAENLDDPELREIVRLRDSWNHVTGVNALSQKRVLVAVNADNMDFFSVAVVSQDPYQVV